MAGMSNDENRTSSTRKDAVGVIKFLPRFFIDRIEKMWIC
jgi:hypothetical protein